MTQSGDTSSRSADQGQHQTLTTPTAFLLLAVASQNAGLTSLEDPQLKLFTTFLLVVVAIDLVLYSFSPVKLVKVSRFAVRAIGVIAAIGFGFAHLSEHRDTGSPSLAFEYPANQSVVCTIQELRIKVASGHKLRLGDEVIVQITPLESMSNWIQKPAQVHSSSEVRVFGQFGERGIHVGKEYAVRVAIGPTARFTEGTILSGWLANSRRTTDTLHVQRGDC